MASRKSRQMAILLMALVLVIVTACSKENTSGKEPSSKPAVTETAKKPEQQVEAGPFGKYDPMITVSTVRKTGDNEEYRKGESLDDNLWTRDLQEILGIKVENKWKIHNSQYDNKITVSMISGDLPDFYEVDAKQLKQLVDAGQAADLTEIYANYASDVTRASLEEYDKIKLEGATFDDKLMAIPLGGGAPGGMQMIWIRHDWLQNLGLEPPKTMDDVIKIALAFTNDDPDGNNKNDTFGLNLDMFLFDGWAGLDGFFNGYHAYPYNPSNGSGTDLIFLKDADGKPVLADTLPEVKTALGKLQELYAAGAIHKEFSVADGSKAGEYATTGQVGMSYGEFWVGTWPIASMKAEDNKVDWRPYPIVSADSKPAHPLGRGGMPDKFMVVNKNAKHPEAVMKILNYFHEKVSGPDADESYHQVIEGEKNYQVFGLSPVIGPGFSNANQEDNDAVQQALKTGETSELSPAAEGYYKGILDYRNGNMEMWFWNALFGPDGAWSINGQYERETPPVLSYYIGQPTATMISKGPILRDLQIKVFTEIINGTRALDDFDTAFVEEWYKQGGQEILDEVVESGRFH
ncbi:extracellular solute-binding protein [Paenibacillaceae bacterium]|nr:extracellular solute-binding protein [Paenibacillaceae bacterium]